MGDVVLRLNIARFNQLISVNKFRGINVSKIKFIFTLYFQFPEFTKSGKLPDETLP